MKLHRLFAEATPQSPEGTAALEQPKDTGDEFTNREAAEEVKTQVSRIWAPLNELMTYVGGLPGPQMATLLEVLGDLRDRLEEDGEYYQAIESARMTGTGTEE